MIFTRTTRSVQSNIKMWGRITRAIRAYFKTTTELDQFITSKRPLSSAEINYWVREYEKRHFNRRHYL